MQNTSDKSSNKSKKQTRFEFLALHEPPTRDDFLSEVLRHLARVRRSIGWTQAKLNDRLGMAARLVNKWECGIKNPSGFNLYCWADALGEKLTTAPKNTLRAVFYLDDGSTIEREFEENKGDITNGEKKQN